MNIVKYNKRKDNQGRGESTSLSSGYFYSDGSSSGSIGQLEMHTIFGQPFDGTQDVEGELEATIVHASTKVITPEGEITSVKGDDLNYLRGTINTLNGDKIGYNSAEFKQAIINALTSTEITTEKLTVTKQAHFFELIIDQIKAAGGAVIFTPCDGFKVDEIVDQNGSYRLKWRATDGDKKIKNMWEVGDQALCETFNAAEGTSYNVSNKYYWALVVGKGTEDDYHYIDISKTDKDGTSTPEVGDEIVMLGHRGEDTQRQSAIYIAAYNSIDNSLTAPLFCQYEGINDFNLPTHKKTYFAANGNQIVGNVTLTTEQIGEIASQVEVGVTILSTEVRYAVTTSGNQPNDSQFTYTSIPSNVEKGKYIWSRTKVTYSDSNVVTTYAVTYTGTNGSSVYITSTSVTYATSQSIYQPSDSQFTNTSIPNVSDGQYLWTKTTVNYSDGTSTTTYSVSKVGSSVSIVSTSVTYAVTQNGTQPNDSAFSSTIPTVNQGDYLWTKTTVTYSDGNSTTTYSVSRIGVDGNVEGLEAERYFLMPSVEDAYVRSNGNLYVYLSYQIYKQVGATSSLVNLDENNLKVTVSHTNLEDVLVADGNKSNVIYNPLAPQNNYLNATSKIKKYEVKLINKTTNQILDKRIINVVFDTVATIQLNKDLNTITSTVQGHTNTLDEINNQVTQITQTQTSITSKVTELENGTKNLIPNGFFDNSDEQPNQSCEYNSNEDLYTMSIVNTDGDYTNNTLKDIDYSNTNGIKLDAGDYILSFIPTTTQNARMMVQWWANANDYSGSSQDMVTTNIISYHANCNEYNDKRQFVNVKITVDKPYFNMYVESMYTDEQDDISWDVYIKDLTLVKANETNSLIQQTATEILQQVGDKYIKIGDGIELNGDTNITGNVEINNADNGFTIYGNGGRRTEILSKSIGSYESFKDKIYQTENKQTFFTLTPNGNSSYKLNPTKFSIGNYKAGDTIKTERFYHNFYADETTLLSSNVGSYFYKQQTISISLYQGDTKIGTYTSNNTINYTVTANSEVFLEVSGNFGINADSKNRMVTRYPSTAQKVYLFFKVDIQTTANDYLLIGYDGIAGNFDKDKTFYIGEEATYFTYGKTSLKITNDGIYKWVGDGIPSRPSWTNALDNINTRFVTEWTSGVAVRTTETSLPEESGDITPTVYMHEKDEFFVNKLNTTVFYILDTPISNIGKKIYFKGNESGARISLKTYNDQQVIVNAGSATKVARYDLNGNAAYVISDGTYWNVFYCE